MVTKTNKEQDLYSQPTSGLTYEEDQRLSELLAKWNGGSISATVLDQISKMTPTVLITGVAGLFGSHFSRHLLDRGYRVIGVDDLSGGYRDFIDERLLSEKFYEVNLLDFEKLDKIIAENRPNYIYHFAAYAAEGLSPFIRNFNYSNNLLASINIINNCVKYNVKKLIFTSSMAVYGHGKAPFKESQTPSPADPYGIAKYAIEMDIKQAHDQFGLQYSIIRPHNVIGVYQNIWDKYRNVIGIWIRQTLSGEPITVFGDGLQKRAFSDIKYYLKPLEMMMQGNNNETFNIGADKEYKLVEVAQIVAKIAKEYGIKAKIKHLETRHEVKYAYCSHIKAKKELKYRDETDIEITIREMFKWAKSQPTRLIKKIPYEIDKKMYSFWK